MSTSSHSGAPRQYIPQARQYILQAPLREKEALLALGHDQHKKRKSRTTRGQDPAAPNPAIPPTGRSPWDRIPNETRSHILGYVDPTSVRTFGLANHEAQTLAQDHILSHAIICGTARNYLSNVAVHNNGNHTGDTPERQRQVVQRVQWHVARGRVPIHVNEWLVQWARADSRSRERTVRVVFVDCSELQVRAVLGRIGSQQRGRLRSFEWVNGALPYTNQVNHALASGLSRVATLHLDGSCSARTFGAFFTTLTSLEFRAATFSSQTLFELIQAISGTTQLRELHIRGDCDGLIPATLPPAAQVQVNHQFTYPIPYLLHAASGHSRLRALSLLVHAHRHPMADLDQHARGLVATSSFPSLTRLFLPPDASLFFRYRDPNIFPHLFELTTFPRLGTFYIGEPSSEFSTAANYALENALEFTPARNLVVVKPNPTLTELDAYHVVLASALAWQPGLAGDMAIKLGLAPEEEEGWLTCARNVQPTKAVWDEEEWGTSEY